MKKSFKRAGLFLLVIATIFSMAVTVSAFSWTMQVGDTLSLLFSDTLYVSSDTSVIEIRSDGSSQYTAIAVGPGTATVTGGTWMGRAQEEYVITVRGSKPGSDTQPTEQTQPDIAETRPDIAETRPDVWETRPDIVETQPIPTKAPQNNPQHSSNVDPFQQMQQTIQGQTNVVRNAFSFTKIIVFVILGLVIALLILAVIFEIKASRFSKQTLGTKVLPPLRTTQQTITAPAAFQTICPNCGQSFGDVAFCGTCGTPRQPKNVHHFPISHKVYAPDFENMVNAWLAENPYIYNCKLHVTTDWTSFAFDLTRKFYVTKASIEFNVSENPVPHRYGVAFLYKKRHFRTGSGEALVDQWQANNPDCKVVSWDNSRISHWENNALTYSLHYNILLFQKPANYQ